MDSCAKHPHEPGSAICRRCGGAWCKDCLVYAFGEKKPPFCMSCAMVAGGVRTGGARPAMPRRELKGLQKASKAEAKAAAKAAKKAPAQEPEEAHVAAAVEVAPPAPVSTGWETPWWEDRQPTFAD
ncbi:MAG: hypothetical protein ACRDZU_11230 [Acidimicrobiales bacterium]